MNPQARTLLLAAVCSMAAPISHAAEIVGTAGSISMDTAQVQALLARQPEQVKQAVQSSPAVLEQLVRADLTSRAVLAEADAAGFSRRPDVVAALTQQREDTLARLWLNSHAQVPEGYPAEADITAAFEQNKAQLRSPEEFHIAQVFIAAADATDPAQVAAALRKTGEVAGKTKGDFAALARASSEHAESAAKGGDLGWVAEDRALPAVMAVVRNLKPGEVAGPVKTDQGFHFVKLVEKRPGRELTLAEARETLVAALRARRSRELQQQYEAELVAKLSININQIALAGLQKAPAAVPAGTGTDRR